MPPSTNLTAIVAGVGPGTGASVARKFSKHYAVVCLARSPASFEGVVKEINDGGGKAVGYAVDLGDEKGMDDVFGKLKEGFEGEKGGLAAAIYNMGGGFIRKPFLELSTEEFMKGLNVSTLSSYLFAKHTVPLLLSTTASNSAPHPPTLIFTGATASMKGSANFSSFASSKFALRALSQSLAREFGPKGVHVSHSIIDGVIDIPRTKEWMNDKPDAKISPEAVSLDPSKIAF
ncbi:MAG: hypothetical protein MMC33_001779 [Icmadophila ericetorum]|nr:hypothetical protein [Icmadophila ericetorum]